MMTFCECSCGNRFANTAYLQIHQTTCDDSTPKKRRKSCRKKTLPKKLSAYVYDEEENISINEEEVFVDGDDDSVIDGNAAVDMVDVFEGDVDDRESSGGFLPDKKETQESLDGVISIS